MTERICPQCGSRFVPDHPKAKWCSSDCKWAFNAVQKRRARQVCKVCGRRFQPSERGRPRKTCSDGCTAKARLAKGRTPRLHGRDTSSFPTGTCHGAARRYMESGQELFCPICGRPAGDDFAQWEVRPFRFSPRAQEKPVAICPRHAGMDPKLIEDIIRLNAQLWKYMGDSPPESFEDGESRGLRPGQADQQI